MIRTMGLRLVVLCTLLFILCTLTAERISYIVTEHPKVVYINKKYVKFANVSSRRHSREDPFYYVDLSFYALSQFGDNVSVSFFFLEFLSNTYRRSFVEMHFKTCEMVKKDKFFGLPLKQGKFLQPCPFPPGRYDFYNMTVSLAQIPKNFPFSKGRIEVNITNTNSRELVTYGYADMEIKEINAKRLKKRNK